MTSHRTATRLVQLVGEDHDALVKKWRDQLTEDLKHKVVWYIHIDHLEGVLVIIGAASNKYVSCSQVMFHDLGNCMTL